MHILKCADSTKLNKTTVSGHHGGLVSLYFYAVLARFNLINLGWLKISQRAICI